MLSVTLCAGGEHRFLCDHVIEGRILMPATSYVATAWEALCIIKSCRMEETPVTFEDIVIRQAVTAEEGQKVLLGVLFAPNHHFCVRICTMTPLHAWPYSEGSVFKTGRGLMLA